MKVSHAFPSSPRAACLLLLSLSGAGCALDKPFVHPDYYEIAPREILVMPVVNRTIRDLSSVTSAGALQALVLKGAGVNVPGVMRRALVDSLEKKGYRVHMDDPLGGDVDYRKPLPPGEGPELDGVVYCDITNWKQAAVSSGGDIEISTTVEMVRAGDASRSGGEVLFRKDPYLYRTNFSQRGVRTTNDLISEVRRAGLRSIRELPACPAGEPAGRPPGEAGGAQRR